MVREILQKHPNLWEPALEGFLKSLGLPARERSLARLGVKLNHATTPQEIPFPTPTELRDLMLETRCRLNPFLGAKAVRP